MEDFEVQEWRGLGLGFRNPLGFFRSLLTYSGCEENPGSPPKATLNPSNPKPRSPINPKPLSPARTPHDTTQSTSTETINPM